LTVEWYLTLAVGREDDESSLLRGKTQRLANFLQPFFEVWQAVRSPLTYNAQAQGVLCPFAYRIASSRFSCLRYVSLRDAFLRDACLRYAYLPFASA